MKYKEILEAVKLSSCTRCGKDRELTVLAKVIVYISIFYMKRRGFSDSNIIVVINRGLDTECVE
jgi:hypothetical protein